ncbi:MAG: PhoH family protein [Lachnospiraceae bacterium]|nr:PhoH family protein [Lachnospiraceae bacterium]
MTENSEFKYSLEIDQESLKLLFGSFDESVARIEKELSVDITDREGKLNIYGCEKDVKRATRLIIDLLESSKAEKKLDRQKIDYGLSLAREDRADVLTELDKDVICRTIQGRPVKPKTEGQKVYVDAIRDKMITFASGPAGTGKTFLAIAMAVTAFKAEEVGRIILTRPAIEAGEKLGFLPGDLQSKIDPYLRPLYDALYQIMGAESFQKNTEKGLIEVAPLAYMRGRTLDNSFIILDEAQNTTPGQMKMFLTRIGFGSKAVITGDLTQKDLAVGTLSGLEEALKVLGNVEEIGFANLSSRDVVRHPLVQRIVTEYEKYEKRRSDNRKRHAGSKSNL